MDDYDILKKYFSDRKFDDLLNENAPESFSDRILLGPGRVIKKSDLNIPSIFIKLPYRLLLLLIDFTFLKYYFFENRNRDTYIILKSIIISVVTLPLTLFLSLYILLSVADLFPFLELTEILESYKTIVVKYFKVTDLNTLLTSWIAVTSILYWNLRKKFSEQWLYCADLYNRTSFGISKYSNEEVLYQRICLSLDLLKLEMHTHESYRTIFNQSLLKSIDFSFSYTRKNENDWEGFKNNLIESHFIVGSGIRFERDLEIQRFLNGNANLEEAKIYLGNFQYFIEDYILESNLDKDD